MNTGKTLIEYGYKPGKWFGPAVEAINAMGELSPDQLREAIARHAPKAFDPIPLRDAGAAPFTMNIEAANDDDRDNIAKVKAHMVELMRVPTLVAGAVMPDACPSDFRPGTIPVGGVVAAKEAIHPGMHSADICCSMAATFFSRDAHPTAILDAGMTLSHFGGGGRPRGGQIKPSDALLTAFTKNPYLARHFSDAIEHFATQGDGNHFFYVGRVASSGQVALVTHHGSRKPGAMLYKAGMAAAEKFTRELSPETPAHNAWIPSESENGRDYWDALQIVREWTKQNHYAIHDKIMDALGLRAEERFWNEHNFVFRRSDGLFYHGKGATPAWKDYASDANGLTLIPLNMAEPILIARGKDAPHGLGFSPHGAGRNFSRTAYLKANAGKTAEQMVAEQAPRIDVRYFSGIPDPSELPWAYKNAANVRAQIERFSLAEVVDVIEPVGNIMAGDWQRDAPWRKKKPPAGAAPASANEKEPE